MTFFYKSYLRTGLALLGAISLCHCHLTDKTIATNEAAAITKDAGPSILLLHYDIRKNPTNTGSALRLVNKTQAPGKLKPDLQERNSSSPGDLICTLLDEKSRPLREIPISNPLRQTLEYIDENGHLAMKTIQLDSARFLLRIQYEPGIRSIAVDQINVPGKTPTRLLRTKIEAL